VKATQLLNEIMAVRLLDGQPVFPFREQEVEPASIDPFTNEILSFGVPSLSLRASLREERWNPHQIPVYAKRDIITVAQFEAWVRRADKVAKDPELADLLRLLDAYTHFQDSRYLEWFVLAWVIVEKHPYRIWKRFLKDEGLSRQRRDKLANTSAWSIDQVIESLGLLKEFTSMNIRYSCR